MNVAYETLIIINIYISEDCKPQFKFQANEQYVFEKQHKQWKSLFLVKIDREHYIDTWLLWARRLLSVMSEMRYSRGSVDGNGLETN